MPSELEMERITMREFDQVELLIGTIIEAEDLPNARNPAYVLTIDFGPYGIKRSSAQITGNYNKEDLIELQVMAVLNFPEKQVGSVMSQCLVTGVPDKNGHIVLASLEQKVPNGTVIR